MAAEVSRCIDHQGWLRYLTHGKGWRKPFTKIRRIMGKHRVRTLSGWQIIASFQV